MTDTPFHVAIILDGNGRWAHARSRPRTAGHRAGARAVRRVVEAAPDLGIDILTLYAFSSDNWKRPQREVRALFRLLGAYLKAETERGVREGVRLTVIGRRDRLPPASLAAIREAESATREGDRLQLRLAIDYSSRHALLEASRKLVETGVTASRATLTRALGEAMHDGTAPDVDLLIRTGGEQRLSDFLLWECAYAELYFTRTMWPDFSPAELEEALEEFRRRERRFGGLPETKAG